MKPIIKKAHGTQVISDFQQCSGTSWDDFTRNHGSVFEDLRGILKNEQNCKCAYCESKLKLKPNHYHVEHIKPRCKFPADTFNYDNVILSCGHKYSNLQEDRSPHCGHVKGCKYPHGFVSPLDSDCSDYFLYHQNGKLSGNPVKSPDRGNITLQLLKLNSISLVENRKAAYKGTLAHILTLPISENEKTQQYQDTERMILETKPPYEVFLLNILKALL